MRIAYTTEHEALRRELRDYFSALMTPERRDLLTNSEDSHGDPATYREVIRQIGHDGWLGIGWPKEYGGQDRSMLEQAIFLEEAAFAGAPIPLLTIASMGPTIMQYGSAEQKDFFLPRILRGELHFAVGYSEPGAGTDLASLRTRAVRDGDEWVINGQKMWTSVIESADYVWLAARTDPDVPKHKGLSMFIVPTDAPGFSYNLVHTLSNQTTSATFYDDVRVPAENLIGGENSGWRLMTSQLNHERVAMTSPANVTNILDEVRRWAQQTELPDGRRVIDQEWVQINLARVHAKTEFLKLLNWKIAWGVEKGLSPADASAAKVFGTEFFPEAYRLLMEVLGSGACLRKDSPGARLQGRLEVLYRSALVLTFGGGTNEIQRELIAMVGLGMPRAPR